MTERKWTPGPWFYNPPDGGTYEGEFYSASGVICNFGYSDFHDNACGDAPSKANALLIAAAVVPAAVGDSDAPSDAALAFMWAPSAAAAAGAVAVLVVLSEFLVPLGSGRWRPLRADTLLPLGALAAGAVAIALHWAPTPRATHSSDPWPVVAPLLVAQALVALHDACAAAILALAHCGALGRPQLHMGLTQLAVASWFGETLDAAALYTVDMCTLRTASAFRRGRGTRRLLDDDPGEEGAVTAQLALVLLAQTVRSTDAPPLFRLLQAPPPSRSPAPQHVRRTGSGEWGEGRR
jgi:hypothetical protein